jgi:hypothetical protein
VAHWLRWVTREFSLEGVSSQPLRLRGSEICAMGKEAFLARVPAFMGDILWEHLDLLQKGTHTIHRKTRSLPGSIAAVIPETGDGGFDAGRNLFVIKTSMSKIL